MEPIHEEEYKGCTIKVYQDEDPISPRDWDTLGTMHCCHSRYELGDVQHSTGADMIYDLLTDFYQSEQLEEDYHWMSGEEFWEKYAPKLEKYYFIEDLYLYDHSGLTMNTTGFSCPWDSGPVGLIVVSKKAVRDEWKVKRISPKLRERIHDLLKGEVEEYNQYLTGQVYGFVVEGPEEEDIHSCWGFFGDYDGYLMEEAKGNVDYWVEEQEKLALIEAQEEEQTTQQEILAETGFFAGPIGYSIEQLVVQT